MARRMGRHLPCICCSKQSTTAKEEEEVVITRLSSSKHTLETKDVSIWKQNLT